MSCFSQNYINTCSILQFSYILGYQHIRMYDLNSNNPNPVINYDGVSKNITSVGFHEDGRWMYTGGEDCLARIWDLRYFRGILFWSHILFCSP